METQPEKKQTSRIWFPMNIPRLCSTLFDLFWRGIHRSQLFSQQRDRPVHPCVPFLLTHALLVATRRACGAVLGSQWRHSSKLACVLTKFYSPRLWHVWKAHIWTGSMLINIEARLFSHAGLCKHRVPKILSAHIKSAVKGCINTRSRMMTEMCAFGTWPTLCGHSCMKIWVESKKGHEKYDLYNQ